MESKVEVDNVVLVTRDLTLSETLLPYFRSTSIICVETIPEDLRLQCIVFDQEFARMM